MTAREPTILGRGQSLGKGMEHELGSDAFILVTLDNGQAGEEREGIG